MSTRRVQLTAIEPTSTTHAGLWLEKYITTQDATDKESRRNLVSQVASIAVPDIYEVVYARWCRVLKMCGARTREATVHGRMVIGLGDESVLEASITLHHTYGVPYIPGSALKGLAASFARQQLDDQWKQKNTAYQTVFGKMEEAGYITFFDALYVPKSGHGSKALHADVLTVHHQGYYQNKGVAPADWDDPTPVPFLSATGQYLLALAGPDEWVSATFKILELALAEMGIGAKTSSGYGRMELKIEDVSGISVEPVDPEQQQTDELIQRIQSLRYQEVAGSIHRFYQQWRELPVDHSHKRRVAEAIIAKVRGIGRERASADKGWYKELLASTQ